MRSIVAVSGVPKMFNKYSLYSVGQFVWIKYNTSLIIMLLYVSTSVIALGSCSILLKSFKSYYDIVNCMINFMQHQWILGLAALETSRVKFKVEFNYY